MNDWILNWVERLTAAASDALGPWAPLLLLPLILFVVYQALRLYVLGVHEPRDKARVDKAYHAHRKEALRLAYEQQALAVLRRNGGRS